MSERRCAVIIVQTDDDDDIAALGDYVFVHNMLEKFDIRASTETQICTLADEEVIAFSPVKRDRVQEYLDKLKKL